MKRERRAIPGPFGFGVLNPYWKWIVGGFIAVIIVLALVATTIKEFMVCTLIILGFCGLLIIGRDDC